MRKTISILLTIVCTAFYTYGQDNNEKLYQAIVKNDTLLVKQLLNEKADPNYIKSEGSWTKVNMLITAVNTGNIKIVKMLLAYKADVNWKDVFNSTALMYAAAKGDKEMVVLLLDNGADINDSDDDGNKVLNAAKESKNKELIKYIEDRLKDN